MVLESGGILRTSRAVLPFCRYGWRVWPATDTRHPSSSHAQCNTSSCHRANGSLAQATPAHRPGAEDTHTELTRETCQFGLKAMSKVTQRHALQMLPPQNLTLCELHGVKTPITSSRTPSGAGLIPMG